MRLLHFHDGKSIVFENSICTFVWNQHHSRTLSEGIRFGGSSGMPTNCDHFWQEGSFVVCPTVIQKNIEIVFSLRYSWAFVRGGGWEGGVNRVSRKYLLSINTYYLLWSWAPSVHTLQVFYSWFELLSNNFRWVPAYPRSPTQWNILFMNLVIKVWRQKCGGLLPL